MSKRHFFSPNLAEKFTITCNLQRIHLTRLAMHAVWWSLTWCILLRIGGISLYHDYIKKTKVHTPTLPWRSIQHVCNFQKSDCIPAPTPPQPAHDTPATYHVYTWTHQQRTMITLKNRKFTHQRCRGVAYSMCATSRKVIASPPQPHPNLHMTHQQRTMCTHEHTSSVPWLH